MTAGNVDPIIGRYTPSLYAEYKHARTHSAATTEYFPNCILLSTPLVFQGVSQLFEQKRGVVVEVVHTSARECVSAWMHFCAHVYLTLS